MHYFYEIIRNILAKQGYIGKYDPRHILAFMYVEHSTLDSMSIEQLKCEIKIAIDCINYSDIETAESLAKSYGL